MADYRFLTIWIVGAPIEPVWEVVHATERWPEWWPGVRSVDAKVLGAPLLAQSSG